MEDSERIFTKLIRSIERSCSELIRLIRDQEKLAVSRDEGRLERLEQEINDLRRRDAEAGAAFTHTGSHPVPAGNTYLEEQDHSGLEQILL